MIELLDKPDSTAFPFNLGNDSVGLLDHQIKNQDGRLGAGVLSIIKRWVDGEIDIVIKVSREGNSRVGDFVFHRVQNQGVEKLNRTCEPEPADFAFRRS